MFYKYVTATCFHAHHLKMFLKCFLSNAIIGDFRGLCQKLLIRIKWRHNLKAAILQI